jgi:hypothetical protein
MKISSCVVQSDGNLHIVAGDGRRVTVIGRNIEEK